MKPNKIVGIMAHLRILVPIKMLVVWVTRSNSPGHRLSKGKGPAYFFSSSLHRQAHPSPGHRLANPAMSTASLLCLKLAFLFLPLIKLQILLSLIFSLRYLFESIASRTYAFTRENEIVIFQRKLFNFLIIYLIWTKRANQIKDHSLIDSIDNSI